MRVPDHLGGLNIPQARLAADTDVFAQDIGHRLVLITCGGAFDQDAPLHREHHRGGRAGTAGARADRHVRADRHSGRHALARTPDGPPPPPAVQRLRLRYAKRGRLRFSSHRDFQRALERALRRAGVPMAYSAGFTPHPKVSYANAAPTGAASEAEYLEIALARQGCDPELLRAGAGRALPAGLDLVDVVEAGPGPLADRLQASVWRWSCPASSPSEPCDAVRAAFLAAESVEVQRMTKPRGPAPFDAGGGAWSGPSRGRTRGSTCRRSGADDRVRYCTWSSGTPHRPFDPTTSWPLSARWLTSRRRLPPW